MNSQKILITIALTILSQNCFSAPEDYFKILEPWSQETQQKYYGEGVPYNAEIFLAINSVLYETPVSLLGMLMEEATNPMTNQEISAIARVCRVLTEPWDRVACAAEKVESTVLVKEFGIIVAPCRAVSTTMIKVFRKLDIPRAWIGYKAANFTMPVGKRRIPLPTFHVANIIVMTGDDGKIYSYVLDLAFYAKNLYPISKAAKELYRLNEDSNSSAQTFPELIRN